MVQETEGVKGRRIIAFMVLVAVVSLAACGRGVNPAPSAAQTAASTVTPAVTVAVTPTVTVSLTASAATVVSGSTAALTWSSTNATSCAAAGAWTGTLPASGSQSTGALTAPASYSLTCKGAGGMSAVVSVTVAVAPLPTITLTPSPASVALGAASTLTWSATNATACAASASWSGARAASGSQTTGALYVPSLYALTCTGPGGSATQSVTVNIIPVATITAAPSVIASGGTSTLTWSSTNAISCAAAGAWSGLKPTAGTLATGALNADTTYALVCSGPGGSSSVARVTVTLASGNLTVSPQAAAITQQQTLQFTATVPGGGAATWSVDGVPSGNTSVGTITSNGLYTAGAAVVGAHSVVATSMANNAQSGSASVAVTDLAGVYTYHNDLARDGANMHEFALTPGTVNTVGFGKQFSCTADGAIYAQPLWVANVTVGGTPHNVVIVATQHDSLFAFDADASPCVTLWSASLIDLNHGAAALGETSVPSGPTGNLVGQGDGDITPEVGVTGTPVIDPTTGTVYVVSKSVNAAQTTIYQRLHAIDVSTGNELPGSPTTIAGTFPSTGGTVTFSAKTQHQRSGLTLMNGKVYVAWASHEDTSPFYGWVMGYTYNGAAFTQSSILNVTPNVRAGGIWMSGGAMAADSNNYLYAITGNGAFDATNATAPNNDYGDCLLRLSASLGVSQYFTPSDQANDAAHDQDFGSGGTAVLADLPAGSPFTHLTLGGGKDGQLYVLNRDNLGGAGDSGAVQKINTASGGIFSTGAFWNNQFYLTPVGTPLRAYSLDISTANFTQTSASATYYSWPGSSPSVSAAGSQGGIVWTLDASQYCTKGSHYGACGPAVLHAYTAVNGGTTMTELWNSSKTAGDTAGYAVKFTVPTIANGHVYVGTRGNNTGGAYGSTAVSGELDVYGLKPN